MNRERGLAIACMALVVLLTSPSAFAAQSSRGFAAYQVSVTTPKGTQSVLINETVGPSDKAGFSDLTLQFIGTEQNFTYSRFVNASEDFLPYLPAVTNQSYQYNNGTAVRISASVTRTGTTSVTFKGSQYALNVLAITVSVRFGNMSSRANGTVETFPSTLVYSASVGNSTDRLQAVLVATDLPLSGPSQMTTATVVGAGLGIGAVAVVGALLIRRREHRVATQGEKPLHWVD